MVYRSRGGLPLAVDPRSSFFSVRPFTDARHGRKREARSIDRGGNPPRRGLPRASIGRIAVPAGALPVPRANDRRRQGQWRGLHRRFCRVPRLSAFPPGGPSVGPPRRCCRGSSTSLTPLPWRSPAAFPPRVPGDRLSACPPWRDPLFARALSVLVPRVDRRRPRTVWYADCGDPRVVVDQSGNVSL